MSIREWVYPLGLCAAVSADKKRGVMCGKVSPGYRDAAE